MSKDNIATRDPLDLEEAVLRVLYEKRYLEKEVKVMRQTQKTNDYIKNQRIKAE